MKSAATTYAGDLNRRVTILRRSAGADTFNEPVDVWETYTTVWASMTPVSDGEKLRSGETLAQRTCRFVIRYSIASATVDPLDRLTFDGRTYDINGVKEVSRREFLEITATARADVQITPTPEFVGLDFSDALNSQYAVVIFPGL